MAYVILRDPNIKPSRPERTLLHEELGFSKQQNEQFEILRKNHQELIKQTNDKIKVLKDRLFIGYGKNIGEEEASEIASKIGSYVAEIELQTLRHFQDVKAICNEEQKVKFDKVIKNVLKDIRPDGPPRPENSNGRPDGPPPRNGEHPQGGPPRP
jgi:periplasmic protein CpxP/Spy